MNLCNPQEKLYPQPLANLQNEVTSPSIERACSLKFCGEEREREEGKGGRERGMKEERKEERKRGRGKERKGGKREGEKEEERKGGREGGKKEKETEKEKISDCILFIL